MNKLRARNEQAPGPTRTETTEVVIPLCNVFLKFCLETWVVQTRNVTFLLALSAACNYFDVSMCVLLFFVIFDKLLLRLVTVIYVVAVHYS
jgi:hypothetical protein